MESNHRVYGPRTLAKPSVAITSRGNANSHAIFSQALARRRLPRRAVTIVLIAAAQCTSASRLTVDTLSFVSRFRVLEACKDFGKNCSYPHRSRLVPTSYRFIRNSYMFGTLCFPRIRTSSIEPITKYVPRVRRNCFVVLRFHVINTPIINSRLCINQITYVCEDR